MELAEFETVNVYTSGIVGSTSPPSGDTTTSSPNLMTSTMRVTLSLTELLSTHVASTENARAPGVSSSGTVTSTVATVDEPAGTV